MDGSQLSLGVLNSNKRQQRVRSCDFIFCSRFCKWTHESMATRTHPSAPSGQSSKPRKPATTPDQLAKDLAGKLKISNAKGKQKVREDEELDSEAKKLVSMRAVNSASQTLSNVAQSGWKKSTGGVSKTTVVSSAAEAAKHLGVLRRISHGDIDVERAALSVLGKLLVLEMVCCIFHSNFKRLIRLLVRSCLFSSRGNASPTLPCYQRLRRTSNYRLE